MKKKFIEWGNYIIKTDQILMISKKENLDANCDVIDYEIKVNMEGGGISQTFDASDEKEFEAVWEFFRETLVAEVNLLA